MRREVHEETGLTIEVRRVLGVASRHFTGPSPRGEIEDFHGLHLVYDAEVSSPSDEPRVVEVDGTTDAVAWLRVDDVRAGRVRAAAVVIEALGWADAAASLNASRRACNLDYMITETPEASAITAWFTGRLPEAWKQQAPSVTVDREEITVRVTIDPVQLGDDASEADRGEAAAGRVSAWREQTRDERIGIAREAEARFEKKVSWGVDVAGDPDASALFTHLAVPVMTRLRQPQRLVLDTLVEAGVARSRADALAWCVRLVGQHSEEWLSELREALEGVQAVRDRGPAA